MILANFDFYIFSNSVHVDKYTAAGFFSACLYLLLLIVAAFCYFDLKRVREMEALDDKELKDIMKDVFDNDEDAEAVDDNVDDAKSTTDAKTTNTNSKDDGENDDDDDIEKKKAVAALSSSADTSASSNSASTPNAAADIMPRGKLAISDNLWNQALVTSFQ